MSWKLQLKTMSGCQNISSTRRNFFKLRIMILSSIFTSKPETRCSHKETFVQLYFFFFFFFCPVLPRLEIQFWRTITSLALRILKLSWKELKSYLLANFIWDDSWPKWWQKHESTNDEILYLCKLINFSDV